MSKVCHVFDPLLLAMLVLNRWPTAWQSCQRSKGFTRPLLVSRIQSLARLEVQAAFTYSNISSLKTQSDRATSQEKKITKTAGKALERKSEKKQQKV